LAFFYDRCSVFEELDTCHIRKVALVFSAPLRAEYSYLQPSVFACSL